MKRSFLLTACCVLIAVFTFDSCKKDEDVPPPVVTAISPDHGPAGTSVTITGSNFATDATVFFNGTQGSVTSVTSTQIVVAVPANATSGAVFVTSNNRSGEGPVFTVEFPPVITSINPVSGKAGDQVTISGSNFSATLNQNSVKFNGVSATVNTASAGQLGVTVPTGVTSGAITVEVNGLTGTGPVFSVIPPPTITSFTPSSGKVGDNVTITGTNFSSTAASNEVKFNGTAATVSSASSTQLVVVVPAGATSGPISVTTNTMTATGSTFTVIPPPTITGINPTSGLAGSNVTITGTNFNTTASANTVKFNGVAATVSTASSTELVVVVPASATSGAVTVEANGMLAAGPAFTVIPPVTVTSIAPQLGPACTAVTITGTNFSSTIADNVVKINGVSVTVTSATATQLVVTVSSSVSTGAVTVTTSSQTATGPTFTVTPNEATMTMDAVDYTYTNFCTSIVSNRFWISASGGFTSPKPSWVIYFTGLRPTTAGAYSADITAERPGETWNFTPATVNVSFDAEGRMVVSFTNVLLAGRSGTADKLFSGTLKVY